MHRWLEGDVWCCVSVGAAPSQGSLGPDGPPTRSSVAYLSFTGLVSRHQQLRGQCSGPRTLPALESEDTGQGDQGAAVARNGEVREPAFLNAGSVWAHPAHHPRRPERS